MQEVTLYTDGACSGNPGPGGYGTVLIFGKHRSELSAGYKRTTNNRMEILAAIAGLDALNRPCRVKVFSDSRYLVDSMNGNWPLKWKARAWKKVGGGRVENVDLWERMLSLSNVHDLCFEWVKGHAGNIENECCDVLATSALASGNLSPDTGYEEAERNKKAQMELFTDQT